MNVGIIDYDLMLNPARKRLNLEIMKLGTYYEEKGYQIDVLSPENNIFYYDMLIVVATHMTLSYGYKQQFEQHPNLLYYGESFSNGNYIPFDNDEINYATPQFKFYNNLLKYFYAKKKYTMEDITKLKETTYVRLYPNKKLINIDKIMNGTKIHIVDNYLFNKPNWQKTLQYLAIFNRYFVFDNLQLVSTQEDLDNFKIMLNYNFIGTKALIRIESLENFELFIENNKEFFKEKHHRFEMLLAYNEKGIYTEEFYKKCFYNSLKLIPIFKKAQLKPFRPAWKNYTNFEFTAEMFRQLVFWFDTNYYNYSFNEYIFDRVRKKRLRDIYVKFIISNPEYKPLVNIIYEKEES